jgi:hypothetical protein
MADELDLDRRRAEPVGLHTTQDLCFWQIALDRVVQRIGGGRSPDRYAVLPTPSDVPGLITSARYYDFDGLSKRPF